MVPQMQKGNDTARTVHIGANIGGIGLFVWQLTSGIPILLKVCVQNVSYVFVLDSIFASSLNILLFFFSL
jgi:hypothetical protein